MKPSVVVIGAGPAGACAASFLAKSGVNVTVLEKAHFPRFVIGESLLPHCMHNLEDAGILAHLPQDAFQLKKGALFISTAGEKQKFDFSVQHTESVGTTWQVKRAEFDHELIRAAEKNGAVVKFGCAVESFEGDANQQRIVYSDQEGVQHEMTCNFVIDSSGYGRVLPRLLDLEVPSTQPVRSVKFTHVQDVNVSGDERNYIEIVTVSEANSWAWIIPFGDGTASVGIVSNDEHTTSGITGSTEDFRALMNEIPRLRERFEGCEFTRDPQFIGGYSIGVKSMVGDGFALCGNSTEFLDPVFSSGVTLATHSGLEAAKCALRQLNGEAVNWVEEYEKPLRDGISVFRSYVNGWYDGTLQKIFYTDLRRDDYERKICSVLAGWVWDETNPFVTKHNTLLKTTAKVIELTRA